MRYRFFLQKTSLFINCLLAVLVWSTISLPLYAQAPTPGKGNATTQAGLPQSSITLTPAQVPANQDTVITIDITGFTLLASDTARVFVNGVEVPTIVINPQRVKIRVPASRIPTLGAYTVSLRAVNVSTFTIGNAILAAAPAAITEKRRIYWLHGLNSEEEDWFAVNSAEWVTTMPNPNDPNYATLLTKYNLWNSLFSQDNVGYKNYIDKILFAGKSDGQTIRYPTKRQTTLQDLQIRYGIANANDAITIPEIAQKTVSLDMNLPDPASNKPLPIAIGHSMGGLVLRSIARQTESTQATHRFGGIITMGTPNNGAALVSGISTNGGLSKNGISVAGEQMAWAIRELGAGPGATILFDPFFRTIAGAGALIFGLSTNNVPLQIGIIAGIGSQAQLLGPAGGFLSAANLVGGAIGLALTANSFIPHNLFNYQQTLSNLVYDGFTISRPNVLDMYVEPDTKGGGKNFSPFLQDLNSPLQPAPRSGRDALNPIPVINIWGNVPESELYSIASANFSRRAQDDSYKLIGRDVPLKSQYLQITPEGLANDKFIPKIVNEVAKPVYVGFSLYYGAIAIATALTGNFAPSALFAFGSIQWIRGWSFLDAGAHIAYRKVIGAYKKEPLISFRIFGFLISIGEKEVRDDSDAFIPAWSQKSNGALDDIKVEPVNHGLMANHPQMNRAFNIIFNSNRPAFTLKP